MEKNGQELAKGAFINRIDIIINEHCGGDKKEFNQIIGRQNADYRWRKESHFPRVEALVRIANRFNVSLDWLLGFTDVKNEGGPESMADQHSMLSPGNNETIEPGQVASEVQRLQLKNQELHNLLQHYRGLTEHYRMLFDRLTPSLGRLPSDPCCGTVEKIQK